jgi:methylglutaconyl-CoA hydratase
LLKIHEEKNIAFISLNRPEVKNAFNPQMIQQLTGAFIQFSKRSDLRAIVLSGEGNVFCAGADLNWMQNMIQYSLDQNKKDSTELFEMFEAIESCQVPVIAVVQGAAFGGALGLIAACDYVLAEEKTQMCFSEVKIGLAPAVISAFVLKKCLGGLMKPLMLTGKVFSPKEVLNSGLVHEVTDAGHMASALAKVVRYFEEASPQAVRETKKLFKSIQLADWKASKELTTSLISRLRISDEGQEGLKSFLEKRNPSWRS